MSPSIAGGEHLGGCISGEDLCRPVPHHDNTYPLGPHVSMPEIASLFCDALHLLPSVASNSPQDSRERVQRHLVAGTPRSTTDSPAPPFPAILVMEPCMCLSIARACWPSNSLVK